MRFVVEQLFRVTHPGCNVCIHIQQLLAYKNQHGFMGRRDFRGAMVDVFGAGGFLWTGEFAVAKNPQTIAQRLNLHSLQFKTGYGRDSRLLAPCVNDYVLIFNKPGSPDVSCRPIIHKTNRKGWVTTEEWVRDANGIWTDIQEIDVLDNARAPSNKEETTERHVCPLQLMLIRRLVCLYSNPIKFQSDVTVLDPFMGIGSVAHVCLCGDTFDGPLEEPRNVIGFELKESYHKAAILNVRKARMAHERRLAEQEGGGAALLPGFGEETEGATEAAAVVEVEAS
jgi:hypothetical protein